MRSNALTRNEVDWGSFETEVNQLAVNAKSIRDQNNEQVKYGGSVQVDQAATSANIIEQAEQWLRE